MKLRPTKRVITVETAQVGVSAKDLPSPFASSISAIIIPQNSHTHSLKYASLSKGSYDCLNIQTRTITGTKLPLWRFECWTLMSQARLVGLQAAEAKY